MNPLQQPCLINVHKLVVLGVGLIEQDVAAQLGIEHDRVVVLAVHRQIVKFGRLAILDALFLLLLVQSVQVEYLQRDREFEHAEKGKSRLKSRTIRGSIFGFEKLGRDDVAYS